MSISTEVDIRVYNANGTRKHFPQQWVTGLDFEIGERGGCLTGTLTAEIEWQNLSLVGNEWCDVRLWGSDQVLYRGWMRQPQQEISTPERVSIALVGLMAICNGYQCRRDYTFAAASIEQAFLAMAQDVVTRTGRLTSLVLDTTGVAALGITIDVFEATGKNVSDAMNALCDLAPGQLIWGCDIDGSGNNRLYLRPRAQQAGVLGAPVPTIYSYSVGGKITAFAYPPDVNQVVNRIIVTGGTLVAPNQPNLVNNPSFETITQPGELTSNLLENWNFQTANGAAPTIPAFWQAAGSTNPSLAQGSGLTGQNALDMPPDGSISQVINVGAGVSLYQSCWLNVPTGGTGKLYMIMTALDSSGSTISTLNSGMITQMASTVGPYVWQHYQQNWTTPAGTVAVEVQYEMDSTSSTGCNIDNCAAWSTTPTNQGWALGISNGAYVGLIDWQHGFEDVPYSPPPFEPGVVMLKVEPVITGTVTGSVWQDIPFVELTTTVDQRVSVDGYETYNVGFRVAADTRGGALDGFISVRVWAQDQLIATYPPMPTQFSIPADGAWHLVTYQFTTVPVGSNTPDSVDVILRLTSTGTYYVDAAQMIQGILGGAGQTLYTLDNTYRGMRDVTSSDIAPNLSYDAAHSITNWYERESQVSNDNVVDEATMSAYALSYLQAHAIPAVQATMTLDQASGPPLGFDGMVRIANLPSPPPLMAVSKVKYVVGDSIRMDVDLNDERPDQATLLRRIQTSGIGGVPWP